MKKTSSFTPTLLIFLTLVFLPNVFAQGTLFQPRVSLIYFLPNDRPARPDRITALQALIQDTQAFFADELERHGYGRKTFTLETDRKGEPVVHQIHGKFNDAHYRRQMESTREVLAEVQEQFDSPQHIYFIAIDINSEMSVPWGGGVGGYNEQRETGTALIAASGDGFNLGVAAHELGHAFALGHDFRDDTYIMSYGGNTHQLSKCAAVWLDVHVFFNNASAQVNRDASIQMLSPTAAPNGIRLRFEVADADGLHQAMLYINTTFHDPVREFKGVKLDGCRLLDAESDTIEFVTSELIDPFQDEVTLQVIDKHGGMKRQKFPINIASLLPRPKVVSVPDRNLAAAVRKAAGLTPNARITDQAMQRLARLEARGSDIKNLTGLEHATHLTILLLSENQIRNINPLAGLTRLTSVGLSNTSISDISPLANLTQLKVLGLSDTSISDISPLANLTQLTELYLFDTSISDISALSNLTQLTYLGLSNTSISDISALSNLTQLTKLYLFDTSISDISALSNLTQLTELHLSNTSISDISPLANLTQLKVLRLSDTSILDAGPKLEVDAGPKLEGPWVWMIASTERNLGTKAASSGKDWLAAASGGSVTEQQIVTHGAIVGNAVGNKVWTLGKIAPTGGNNMTEMVNAIGLEQGTYIGDHVAYGSISLDSPREQHTTMYVGSDDSVKVWLNGVLVHNNSVERGANDYQENFPVTLKQGRNILVVAVYNGGGPWSGFFGFKNDAIYSLAPASVVHVDAAQRPPLYWVDATTGTLHRLVNDEVENLVPTVKNATGLAVDMMGGKLYWTEKTGERTGRIRSANLDGTNVKLVKNLTSVPQSIALDAANGKLYLANGWGKIQRMDLNGSNFQSNLITDLNAPRHLTLDVAGGKVYWTETAQNGRIRRASLDGSKVQNVATGLTAPLSLTVASGKVYWTSGRRLHRANLDGSNRRALETLPNVPTSIAFDPARNLLYLTSPPGGIYRRNLDDIVYQPIVTGFVSPSNIVLGISATDPVTTDTPTPPAEPVGDTAADVNPDKKVNKTDLLLVVTALGESPPANPNFDVNADGTVDIADVLLVIDALDDPVAAAAPSFGETLTALDPARLALQIDLLRAESDGSMKYAHAIAFFQSLLASIRPTETQLLANYPNPFNPETWIPYQLAKASDVRITIYDARGVIVRQLVLGHQAAGFYTSRSRAAYWDGRNALGERVASGIYFYQLQTDNVSSLRKMLILK